MRDGGWGRRLVDLDPGSAEARLLAQAQDPRPLSPEALARIEDRLRPRARRKVVRRTRLRWMALVVVGVAGAAGAGTLASRAFETVTPAARPQAALPRPALHRRVDPPVAEVAPAPVVPSAPAPRRVSERPRPLARAAPAPEEKPAVASSLADESALLGVALRRLRQDRDGKGALAALDDYRARFSRGELAHEASRTRVEALLLLGQTRPALSVLEGMPLGGSTRDVELALVRGELRAQAGRCVEAEADFTTALARLRAGAGIERALFGRASCRSRRGETAGARADLELLLARFPDGKHAADAHRALADR